MYAQQLYNGGDHYGTRYYVNNNTNTYVCVYVTPDISNNVTGSVQYRTQLNQGETNIAIGEYVRAANTAWETHVRYTWEAGQCH